MAGIWADFPSGSHGLYGDSTAAMLNGPWAEASCSLRDDPDPLIGAAGRVLYQVGGSHVIARLTLPSAQTTVGLAQRIWMPSLETAGGGRNIVNEWRDGSGNVICYFFVTDTGSFAFVNGSSGSATPLFETSGPVITANGWWHVEAKLTAGLASNATIEIRVNGITKMNETGFTTSTGNVSQVSFNRGRSGMYHKDICVWDGSGSQANDFQGTVTVYYNPVVQDNTTTGWTFSSGTNASALIGHAGPPVDTAFISANSTPPGPAEMTLADLPPDITSVRFVVPVVRAAKIDGGDGNIQTSLSPDGTNYDNGPDTPITTAFTFWGNATYPFVSHLNPATGTPWLPVDFTNGVRLKITRTV